MYFSFVSKWRTGIATCVLASLLLQDLPMYSAVSYSSPLIAGPLETQALSEPLLTGHAIRALAAVPFVIVLIRAFLGHADHPSTILAAGTGAGTALEALFGRKPPRVLSPDEIASLIEAFPELAKELKNHVVYQDPNGTENADYFLVETPAGVEILERSYESRGTPTSTVLTSLPLVSVLTHGLHHTPTDPVAVDDGITHRHYGDYPLHTITKTGVPGLINEKQALLLTFRPEDRLAALQRTVAEARPEDRLAILEKHVFSLSIVEAQALYGDEGLIHLRALEAHLAPIQTPDPVEFQKKTFEQNLRVLLWPWLTSAVRPAAPTIDAATRQAVAYLLDHSPEAVRFIAEENHMRFYQFSIAGQTIAIGVNPEPDIQREEIRLSFQSLVDSLGFGGLPLYAAAYSLRLWVYDALTNRVSRANLRHILREGHLSLKSPGLCILRLSTTAQFGTSLTSEEEGALIQFRVRSPRSEGALFFVRLSPQEQRNLASVGFVSQETGHWKEPLTMERLDRDSNFWALVVPVAGRATDYQFRFLLRYPGRMQPTTGHYRTVRNGADINAIEDLPHSALFNRDDAMDQLRVPQAAYALVLNIVFNANSPASSTRSDLLERKPWEAKDAETRYGVEGCALAERAAALFLAPGETDAHQAVFIAEFLRAAHQTRGLRRAEAWLAWHLFLWIYKHPLAWIGFSQPAMHVALYGLMIAPDLWLLMLFRHPAPGAVHRDRLDNHAFTGLFADRIHLKTLVQIIEQQLRTRGVHILDVLNETSLFQQDILPFNQIAILLAHTNTGNRLNFHSLAQIAA
jgi:hypothetical protein